MICPYCGSPATCVDSSMIYGRSYGFAWVCANYPECDSYCGCHPGTKKPLGRLADKYLRAAKVAAHNAFDRLWKPGKFNRFGRRKDAYRWLAGEMGLAISDTHIGEFDVDQCLRVRELCMALRGQLA